MTLINYNYLDQTLTTQSVTPTKECVVFLIDVGPSMHLLFEEDNTTPLTTILKVTENFLKSKIIASDKDPFGIVLFNSLLAVNDMNLEGVNNIVPVHPPNAMTIKRIKEMYQKCSPQLNRDNYQKELSSIFAPNEDLTKNYINDALWVCHSLLKVYERKIYKRRVFLFTDNDDPIKNEQEKNICIQRATDMSESDIIIEIFPMNFRRKFNLGNFYALIVPRNSDDDINSSGDNIVTIEQCVDRLKEISRRIRQKEMKKRTLTKCPFQLTENSRIYLNIYSNIKKATKGRMFTIDTLTNKLLKSVSTMKCKDTEEELYPEQIGTYVSYGNKKVKFSKEEMKKIKIMEAPGMTLLGFKSIECIRPYHNVRESYFLYPNEALSNGSGKLVDALIKQMLSKKKCAIVKFIAREGSLVRYCALLPQIERYDEDFFQTPPGFNMIVLPYADDIRHNSDLLAKCPDRVPRLSDKMVELARKIVRKMNITFDCRCFENFELQKFYSTLQALALNESNIEDVEDTLQPNKEALDKVLEGIDEKYHKLFFEKDGEEDSIKMCRKKRHRNNGYNGGGEEEDWRSNRGRGMKGRDSSEESNSSEVSLEIRRKKWKEKIEKREKRDQERRDKIERREEQKKEREKRNAEKKAKGRGRRGRKKKYEDMEKENSSSSSDSEDGGKKNTIKTKKNYSSSSDSSDSSDSDKKNKKKKEDKKEKNDKKKKKRFTSSSSDSDISESIRERDKNKDKDRDNDEESSDYSRTELLKMLKNNEIEKLSMFKLRRVCEGRGISTEGLKKGELIEKIKLKIIVIHKK